MPDASRSPGSSTRSWRGVARSRQRTAGRRWTKRVLMTLLGTGLLAIFGWLLWRWAFLPRIHLFALPIVHYDVLAVPPISFSSEDLAQLTAPPPDGPEVNSRNVLVGLETSKSIPTLSDRLQGVATRPRDNLILYLAGHGVSEGGTAYLLCSDYLRGGGPGRYKLADLLRQVSDCPAAVKLVLLDVGHLAADPRLGLVVNEFPRLLEAEVKQLDDPALWVLTANRPFETCHVWHGMKRSVFGLFVAEALRGAADRDGDRAIDLDEFFFFVRDRVAAWVNRESDGRLSQTPWLLRGRLGAADPPAHLALLPAPKRPKKAESQDGVTEPKAEEGNNAENKEGQPSTEESKGPEKTVKKNNSDAAQAPPDRQKPPSQNPARIEVRQLLDEAWALRDLMQGRTGAYAWSPVDYAPHLWRELQQLLLGYELQYRAGAAFDAEELAGHLKTNILPLRQLVNGGSLPAGIGRSTVLFRLADARKTFLAGRPKASFEQESAEVAAVREAMQLKNDLLFWAPYYVRWHAHASLGAARPVPLYEPISELLDERLPAFSDLLESVEGQSPANASPAADLQGKVRQIGLAKEALEKLRQRIEKDGLEREAQQLSAESRRDPRPKGLSNRIVALLNTPLPPAPLRMSLLDALQQPTPLSLEEAMAAVGPAPSAAPIATWQWERLAQRAHLEVSIARVADPDFATSLDPLIGNARPTSPSAQSEQELWQGYRNLGKELQAFYEALPARIAGGLGASDLPRVRLSERLLRVVDARDAARVGSEACSIALRPLPSLGPPEASIEVTGPATLRADPDHWTPLDVTVRATGAPAAGTWLALEYKPDLLTLESLKGTPTPEPDQEIQIPLGPNQPCQLRYQVRAAVEVDSEVTTPLVFKVRAGKVTKPSRVEVTILPRDVVELVVQADPAIAVGRSDAPLKVRLRPFPNRPTTYQFALVNRSGRQKSATVELLALPAVPARQPWTEDLLWDSLGNLKQGIEVVAGPLSVDLPAEPTPKAIPFPAPKPAEPEGKAAPPEGKAAPPAAPKEPPGPKTRPDVTHGMACVIRDTAGGKWTWRIELRPLAPKDYLDPDVSYHLLNRKLVIEVKAPDTDGDGKPNDELLPPIGPDNPIPVVWETAGVLDPGTEMNDQGTLGPPDYVARLSAVVESAPDKEIRVWLTVDGYPRAFRYQVKCDRDRQRVERQRGIGDEVRITAPQPDQAFRAPLDSLSVEFQLDAPEDAFQQPGDMVEVGIDANGDRLLQGEPRRELLADRQARVFLDGTAPQGLVKVDTNVGDLVVSLAPGGRKNTAVEVVARLVLPNLRPGGDPIALEKAVPVLLDGGPPEVQVEVPGRPVAQGVDVPISVETKDLSGVVKMEFGFDVNGSSDLEADEQPKILQQKILPERGADGQYTQAWDTTLPTKDLEPGRYRLMVRATDRVNISGKSFQEVTIAAPVKPSTTSTIQGRVVYGDESIPRVEVRIENTGLRAVTDQDGRFVFKDVPHGAYKLQAKGIARNRFREGSAEVTLPGPKEPAVVEIPLE